MVSHALKIRFGRLVNIILFIQSLYFKIFIAFQVNRLNATISNRPRSRTAYGYVETQKSGFRIGFRKTEPNRTNVKKLKVRSFAFFKTEDQY